MSTRTIALAVSMLAWSHGAMAQESPGEKPYCSGEYADDLGQLAAKARELEQKPYSYCVRNSAVYECLSYSADGAIRRVRKKATLHGTAFGYKAQAGETLLLTNEHVAEWPIVTDESHRVDGVPSGCKRISDSIRIVDNEADDYDRDDIPLQRVVVDPQLDAAVLKAKTELAVLPWKLGKSAALRERNVVEVRGFPLGAFQATNVGKVVSAYDHDDEKEWDHDDFVIDALLSAGNSGSPVLAVSCKTGEFELVGLYHAGYSEGSALNVAVGIDQLRDLMTTLKRVPRTHVDASEEPDAARREQLTAQLKATGDITFPFGSLVANARLRGDAALVFEIFSRDFPFQNIPIFVFEDLPTAAPTFGEPGRIWFGNERGMKVYGRSDLDADTQAQVSKIFDALKRDVVAFLEYRNRLNEPAVSRDDYERTSRLGRSLRRTIFALRDLSSAVVDLADRLSPHVADPVAHLSELMTPQPIATRAVAQVPTVSERKNHPGE